MKYTAFPRCHQSSDQIIETLPRNCPLGDANPADGLTRLRDRAWTLAAQDDFERANPVFRVLDICTECVGRLLRDQHVKKPTGTIANLAETPTDTCNVWLSDLRLLGIANRQGVGRFEWQLRPEFERTITGAGLWAGTSYRGVPPDSAPPQTPEISEMCSEAEPTPVSRGAKSPPLPPMPYTRFRRRRRISSLP